MQTIINISDRLVKTATDSFTRYLYFQNKIPLWLFGFLY